MMRMILMSQKLHQQSGWEQESCRAEGLGRPCIGVPVAGPARVFHIVVWNRNVVWYSAVHLWIAYLTERGGLSLSEANKRKNPKWWFHLELYLPSHTVAEFYFLFYLSSSTGALWPVHGLSMTLAWVPVQLSNNSVPHFSPSQPQSGHGGGFSPAPLSLPHRSILSSAAQPPGWAPWTRPPGPQGAWQKRPQLLPRIPQAPCSVASPVLTLWRRRNLHQNPRFPLRPPSWYSQSGLWGEQLRWGEDGWSQEGAKAVRVVGNRQCPQRLFTCDIRQFGCLLAGHVVVVEVHHDDPFFFSLRRWTEEETLNDLETLMVWAGTRLCHFCSVRQENL